MRISKCTERLSIQPLTIDDAEFILELLNSEGWLKFIGDRNINTNEEARNFIEKINSTNNLTYLVVRLKEDQVPIGIISFIKRSYLQHFDIGFAFLPAFTGKGYAYEAATEVLSVANESLPGAPILATTLAENINSIRLLKKLGLHFEKELQVEENRKVLLYSTAENEGQVN